MIISHRRPSSNSKSSRRHREYEMRLNGYMEAVTHFLEDILLHHRHKNIQREIEG
jgi:hypothetical protein